MNFNVQVNFQILYIIIKFLLKKECDDGCATCSEAGSCDISCPVNCEICNPDETCITAKDGYYVDPIT